MLFTRRREAAAAAAAAAARASSSSEPNPRSEHGAGSTPPPTRKLRSLLSKTSRFIANARAPAAPTAARVAARVAAPAVDPASSSSAARVAARVAARAGDPASSSAAANLGVKKSSRFRGVTKHRVTTRFEAHLWDKSAYNTKQKKGRQVYLGAYDDEVSAAKAYDLAALKYWGPTTTINFTVENYTQQLEEMKEMSRSEFLAGLRRKSSGFSRGLSKFRGVARHHQNGRWEARIGRVEGNKYLYLGTFGTQEEAAEAYDKAAIKYRGTTAVTNFELSRYQEDVEVMQRPRNNASKNSFKDNRISKTIEGGLPNDLQTITSMVQSLDGGQNLSTTNTMNPCLDASVGATTLDIPHTSKLVNDCCQPEQEKVTMQFQDSVFAGVGETSGLDNTTLKNAKPEGFFDHIASSNDLNLVLGIDYDEFIGHFNFQSPILTDFESNG